MFKEKLPVLMLKALSCLKNYFQKVQDMPLEAGVRHFKTSV